MSTVAIVHPRDPKRPTVIPADRFDPDVHELWDDSGVPTYTALPDDLPGRAALIEAGITTTERLAETHDFGAVPGIGEKTEAKLRAYLEGS